MIRLGIVRRVSSLEYLRSFGETPSTISTIRHIHGQMRTFGLLSVENRLHRKLGLMPTFDPETAL